MKLEQKREEKKKNKNVRHQIIIRTIKKQQLAKEKEKTEITNNILTH